MEIEGGYGLSGFDLKSYYHTPYILQTLSNNLYNWFKYNKLCEITVYKDNIWPFIFNYSDTT